jgi:hypothetical protein
MHMRIIWGKILPGQWDAFEAAFKKALEIRGEAKGLKSQWLLRDENDPNAGYSISQWESEEDRGGRVGLNSVSVPIDGLPANYLHRLPRRRTSCGLRQRQATEIGLVGRPAVQARVRPLAVVEGQISADRAARLSHAVIGT